MATKNIAVFASGTGTNADNIVQYFGRHACIKVGLIACNKPGVGVWEVSKKHGIDTLFIDKEKFILDGYLSDLRKAGIDFIILAGFLLKVPEVLINSYRNNIINIHPALLPKFGGKGMYGLKVHEAVIEAGETESGITIHYVDEHFDKGDRIFQAKCPVLHVDTPTSLANKVHELEYEHFPKIIEECILKSITV